MRPDPNERGQADEQEEAIDHDQQWRRDARRVGPRRGDITHLAPDRGSKAETAEQYQHRSGRAGQPGRDDLVEQSARTDSRGERGEAGPHPGGISPLGGEYGAIGGKLGAAIGAVGLLLGARGQAARTIGELHIGLGDGLLLIGVHR